MNRKQNKFAFILLTFLMLTFVYGVKIMNANATLVSTSSYSLDTEVITLNPEVSKPISIKTKVSTTGSGVTGGIFQVQIFKTSDNSKVLSKNFENQTIISSAPNTYTVEWTPKLAGEYYVKAGVFTSNWVQNTFWTSNALTFNINSPVLKPTSIAENYSAKVNLVPALPIKGVPTVLNLNLKNQSTNLSEGIVQIQIFKKTDNSKVLSKNFEGENISLNQIKNYTLTWTPLEVGDYYVKVGVFTKDWVKNVYWNSEALTFQAINPLVVIPSPTPIPTPVSTTDKFGIKKIYPSLETGMSWTSSWDNGVMRAFTGKDPKDPWFDADHGDASYSVDGKGIFSVTGQYPRMYIHEPNLTKSWGNVEMTVYAKRVSDAGTDWGGIVGIARANHGTSANELENPCDTRGIGARIRYDGKMDFEKETSHPSSQVVKSETIWPDGMPKNTWIGYKYMVYDLSNGNVKLELWMDLTDGANGGEWKKINEFIDNGGNFGVNGKACAAGINPGLKLTKSNTRAGSESGKPNATVYWRSDDVGTNGLLYKKMSVREIK